MTITVSDIFRRVQAVLNDAGGTRWPLPELLRHVNDCPREISQIAPEVLSQPGIVTLVAGCLQSLPNDAYSLIRVTCNITQVSPSVVRGRVVTPVKRLMLDSSIPGWQQATVVPYTAEVAHLIEDDQSHRTFMVFPGNNGTGRIEIVVSRRLAEIAEPASPTALASYDALSLNLDAAYLPTLTDYVVAKAFEKDINVPASAVRAQAHYARFVQSLGGKLESEARASTNSQKTGA